jgi:predicted MPP superfamily phosphohydrolase
MSKPREKYVVLGVDLYHVRNRNEQRIVKHMIDVIAEKRLENKLSSQDIKDIYAYSLNQLDSRYTQQGTIVLRDPVRNDMIDQVVDEAILLIMTHPKEKG